MTMSSVSSKGQVTLPVALRRKCGLKPRSRVLFEAVEGGIIIRPAPDFFALSGFLGKALPRDEEKRRMMAGVARRAKGGRR